MQAWLDPFATHRSDLKQEATLKFWMEQWHAAKELASKKDRKFLDKFLNQYNAKRKRKAERLKEKEAQRRTPK